MEINKNLVELAKKFKLEFDEETAQETINNKMEYNAITLNNHAYRNLTKEIIKKRVGFFIGSVAVAGENKENETNTMHLFNRGRGKSVLRTIALNTHISRDVCLFLDPQSGKTEIRTNENYAVGREYIPELGIRITRLLVYLGSIGKEDIFIYYVKTGEKAVTAETIGVLEGKERKVGTVELNIKEIPVTFFSAVNTVDSTTEERPLASYLAGESKMYNELDEFVNEIARYSAYPVTYFMDVENGNKKINSKKPGVLWDLKSEYGENKTGQVGTVTGDHAIIETLEKKKERILRDVTLASNLPDPIGTNSRMAYSGKSLTIQYWELQGEAKTSVGRWANSISKYINNINNWEGTNAINITVNTALSEFLNLEAKADAVQELRMGIRSKQSYVEQFTDLDYSTEQKRLEKEEYSEDNPLYFD